MPYRPAETDPDPDAVRRLTIVPFLPDGHCAVIDATDGPRLPHGAVAPGEHWLVDGAQRVPLETAGYKPQRVHPFAADGDHLYVWCDGDRYAGRRPHATVPWITGNAASIADRLAAAGRPDQAIAVRDGHRSFTAQTDESYYADNRRLLEPAYLRGDTVWAGSGFGSGPDEWRARRSMIVDGVHRSGTFLDVGCANGLLMESVREWAAERGHTLEPYGVDLAPGLVELARSRLPHWADRIAVGNAIDWRPAHGRLFAFVHLLLDLVPARRRADLVRHGLSLVEPDGRLLVSVYQPIGGSLPGVAELVRGLGFPVVGESHARTGDGTASTAWLTVPPSGRPPNAMLCYEYKFGL
ncbi:class I SAM-dependent methyltransferase [Plantactinospora sp. GCM10030261]|uniref:class I SAM-dependent methyltransferase n=1 Tax=Plantactinospora sp. GCM10030261 TaxID=3273420 RepID=UPI003612A213